MMEALNGLPVMSADEAHLRQAIPAALSGREADGAVLRAAMLEAVPGAVAWFRCADGIGFAFERLWDRPVAADPADGPAMAALLERAEALLDAVEQALGLTLEPVDIGSLEGDGPRLFARVEAQGEEGAPGASLLLAVPSDAALLPASAPFSAALSAHVPVPVRISFSAPRLSPAQAGALAPGDLLLLGAGPIEAVLRLPDGTAVPGRIDAAARHFTPLS